MVLKAIVNGLTKGLKNLVDHAKAVISPTHYAANRQAENTSRMIESNTALAERREAAQLVQLKLNYLQQGENRNFQAWQAEENHKQAKELQEFIQSVQFTIAQKNIDFQRWRFEQEKVLQAELAAYNRETQQMVAAYQRETAFKQPEVNKLFETWPLRIVPSLILNSHHNQGLIPLRIILAPPEVDFDRFGSATQGIPRIEKRLAEGLRQFLSKNYPLSSETRPTEFLDGAWDSKRFHGGSSIKALFGMLNSEPVLVLESEIDGDYLNFRCGYWGVGAARYSYDSIISGLPYREIVYESAKSRALKWKPARDKLLQMAQNPKVINEVDTHNLEVLEQEEALQQAGVDVSNLPRRYKVNNEDFEALCQFLIAWHCLVAGLWADAYFLTHHDVAPLLPELLPDLTKDIPESQVVPSVVSIYQEIYKALGTERSAWVPELSVQLAKSLGHLPDKSWAREQVQHSMQSWLKLRGIEQPEDFEALLEAVESSLTVEDQRYIEELNECLAKIDSDKFLNLPMIYYNRGIINYQQGDYKTALSSFNQVIEFTSEWAEAYYNRGLAYTNLKQYQEAIEDFTQALNINPNYAEAERQRKICQDDWEQQTQRQQKEVERQRKLEEERKRKLKNVSLVRTFGHSKSVNCVAISSDGQTLASASDDKTIKIWDLSTGKLLPTLSKHSDRVLCIAISPDGHTVVSVSYGGVVSGSYADFVSGSYGDTIKIWDLRTGVLLHSYGHSKSVNCVAISPGGRTLASASDDKTIKIWDLSTGVLLRTLSKHSDRVLCVAISPDGQTLASGGSKDKTINIWFLSTGELYRTLIGHSDWVRSVAISSDGHTVVSASDDKTIKIWNLITGELYRTLIGHSDCVRSVAISSDGHTVVSGSKDDTIKIWDLSTGELLRTLSGHSGSVNSVAISPDGQTLVSGSYDNTIKIWQVPEL